jgi:hypothetical protein
MKLTGDRNQCRGCNSYFNSTDAFNKHRTGPHNRRRCLTDVEMLGKGMVKNAAGFWVGSPMPQRASLYWQNSDDHGSVGIGVATHPFNA